MGTSEGPGVATILVGKTEGKQTHNEVHMAVHATRKHSDTATGSSSLFKNSPGEMTRYSLQHKGLSPEQRRDPLGHRP